MMRKWTDYAYCTFPIFHPQNPSILIGMGGKKVGLRSDGQRLSVAVILPTVWPEFFDWTALATERLNTMLEDECSCSQFGQCPKHQVLAQSWAAADLAKNVIVPEMVPEILQGIVTPKKAKSPIILT